MTTATDEQEWTRCGWCGRTFVPREARLRFPTGDDTHIVVCNRCALPVRDELRRQRAKLPDGDREFYMTIRRAFLMAIKAIEARYGTCDCRPACADERTSLTAEKSPLYGETHTGV